MVVYVEAVILDNFCLDCLLGYLTLRLSRGRVGFLRIVLSALFGTAVALVFPLIPSAFSPLVKVATLLLCVLIFSLKSSLRSFLIRLFLYAVLSFSLCGLLTFLLGADEKGFIGVSFGGAVALLSVASLLMCYAVRQIGGLIRERRANEKRVVAEIVKDDKSVRLNALFDSGNLLTDERGAGVVVTDRRRLAPLGELERHGEMRVKTASGSRVLSLVKIPLIKIYSREGENILTNVTAALSDLPDEYALILPCE
ncbi:MAG: sigma-E processing peptidase SpoIIGA [Clostridia bacterium]|nr:sigma-E processing peptidase SpoIIGA [Clostridia bacterium]